MIFSSNIFLFLFLPITLFGYFIIRKEFRNVFLLLVSLLFYASGEPKFVFIMLLSIFINYTMGIIIEYAKNNLSIFSNRIIIFVTVFLNLGILFYFKYMDFFISSLNSLFKLDIALTNIVLPIGISFFTFQGMSYTLDLYMGKVEVQKNPLNIALYIALFPQLIAGPIVRYKDVNEQIDNRTCSVDKFSYGIERFIIGISKKVIIANQVGFIADKIFANNPNENSILVAWAGIICYSIQIYFDFSGYSDMAIGLGKMFGFDFLENFNYPYVSTSITEFWRRWHISLSTWFRDYVYIPLGGNRSGNMYFNLFIVFFITGLWHGASWNFVVWGLWHGMFLIIEKIIKLKNIDFKIPKILKWIITMNIVIIGWVMFRSPNLSYALEYIGVMFGVVESNNIGFDITYYITPKIMFILIIAFIGSAPLKLLFNKLFKSIEKTYFELLARYIYLFFIFFVSIMLIMTSTYNPFIYFRF